MLFYLKTNSVAICPGSFNIFTGIKFSGYDYVLPLFVYLFQIPHFRLNCNNIVSIAAFNKTVKLYHGGHLVFMQISDGSKYLDI